MGYSSSSFTLGRPCYISGLADLLVDLDIFAICVTLSCLESGSMYLFGQNRQGVWLRSAGHRDNLASREHA